MRNPLKIEIIKRKNKTYSIVMRRSGRIILTANGYNTKYGAQKTLINVIDAFQEMKYEIALSKKQEVKSDNK